MVQPEHEHTLNVWLADLLRKNHGIDAPAGAETSRWRVDGCRSPYRSCQDRARS